MKNKKGYIIAIPSYKRVDIIQKKTLKLLHEHNINPKLIKIFVANQSEYDEYKAQIPSELYGELIIGEIGLKNQRNFISDYYPEGTNIVQMDDDVEKIVELHQRVNISSKTKHSKSKVNISTKSKGEGNGKGKTQKLLAFAAFKKANNYTKPIKDLDGFIKSAFALCKEKQAYLWGVYPIANAYFMTDTVTTDLRFIVGPMWGMINRHLDELKLTLDEKENTQRTLQYFTKDGVVIRFNNIGIETNYYANKGGMQAEGKTRAEQAMKSAQILHATYPSLTRIFARAKTGFSEVKLLKKAKNV